MHLQHDRVMPLFEAMKAGNEGAFIELHAVLARPLMAYCLAFTSSRDDAEDLFQHTIVAVYEKRHQFTTGNLAAWIFTIARNAGRALNKHEQRFEMMDETFDVVDDDTPLMDADEVALVQQSILSLPEEFKQVVMLKYYGEMTTQEIAQAEAISEALVRTRLHRARQKLAQILAPIIATAKPLEMHLVNASSAWTSSMSLSVARPAHDVIRRMHNHTHASSRHLRSLAAPALFLFLFVFSVATVSNNPQLFRPNDTRQQARSPHAPPPSNADAQSALTSLQGSSSELQLPPVSPLATHGTDELTVSANNPDGFADEYMRVLTTAQRLQQTDAVAAAQTYLGLARLCELRGKKALAEDARLKAEDLLAGVTLRR